MRYKAKNRVYSQWENEHWWLGFIQGTNMKVENILFVDREKLKTALFFEKKIPWL